MAHGPADSAHLHRSPVLGVQIVPETNYLRHNATSRGWASAAAPKDPSSFSDPEVTKYLRPHVETTLSFFPQ